MPVKKVNTSEGKELPGNEAEAMDEEANNEEDAACAATEEESGEEAGEEEEEVDDEGDEDHETGEAEEEDDEEENEEEGSGEDDEDQETEEANEDEETEAEEERSEEEEEVEDQVGALRDRDQARLWVNEARSHLAKLRGDPGKMSFDIEAGRYTDEGGRFSGWGRIATGPLATLVIGVIGVTLGAIIGGDKRSVEVKEGGPWVKHLGEETAEGFSDVNRLLYAGWGCAIGLLLGYIISLIYTRQQGRAQDREIRRFVRDILPHSFYDLCTQDARDGTHIAREVLAEIRKCYFGETSTDIIGNPRVASRLLIGLILGLQQAPAFELGRVRRSVTRRGRSFASSGYASRCCSGGFTLAKRANRSAVNGIIAAGD